jgi:hypothetical protein
MSPIPDFNDFSKPAFISELARQAGSERGITPGGLKLVSKPVKNKNLPNLFPSFNQVFYKETD